jgi:hypothetical protein
MPCNSDYMEASGKEIALSRVACLLDELDGKPLNPSHWGGYHPAVYNKGDVAGVGGTAGDAMVSELCSRLQAIDVTKYSLEMQMWWRDHQAADKARIEHELARKKDETERRAAIAKLTPHERKLLGL